jgi:hypothetical protein
MSELLKEKWTWDAEEGVLLDARGRRVHVDYLFGPAMATLPEALALLADMSQYDKDEECEYLTTGHHVRVKNLLRRAGVLK